MPPTLTPAPPGDPEAVPALARLVVDLDALAANYRTLRALAPAAEVAAVVKANAYGLGVGPVALALAGAGCTTFFVATVQEALQLRALHDTAAIYTLGGVPGRSAAVLAAARVRPVLNCLEDAQAWARDAAGAPCALQLDSGLTRSGFDEPMLAHLLAQDGLYAQLGVALLVTHYASADEPDSAHNAAQRAVFERMRGRLPPLPTSCANSAGVLLGPPYCGDIVRPGIALYGGQPVAHGANPMQAVVRLEARVLQTRELAAAAWVGYGASARAGAGARLAILGIGYADGYPRALGNGAGCALIAGVQAPVIGRVSMDLTTLDVSQVPADALRVGGYVTLIGPGLPLERVAAAAGTLGYEILTGLGARVERTYVRAR